MIATTQRVESMNVRKEGSRLYCNCPKLKHNGLPCVHALAVWDRAEFLDYTFLHISSRWFPPPSESQQENIEYPLESGLVNREEEEESLRINNPNKVIRPGRIKKPKRYL